MQGILYVDSDREEAMQTILQVLIGVSPLILVSLIYLIRRKLTVIPIITVLCCFAVLGYGLFAWNGKEEKALRQQKVISGDDYLYLAENSILTGDYNKAEEYLSDMSAEVGDTPERTLCYARLAAVKGDYDRAGALYKKLQTKSETAELLTEADRALLADIESGSILNQTEAAGELAAINALFDSGADITEYGYTEQQTAVLEKSASGNAGYAKDIISAIEKDMEKQSSEKEDRYENLSEAAEAAAAVQEEYRNYKDNGSFDEERLDDAYDDLSDIFKENADIFGIDEIDEAYVMALVVKGKDKELGEYAEATDSQTALIAIAQLIIDGEMSERSLPDGFVTITEEELQVIKEQAEEALRYIEEHDLAEGAALKKLSDAVENIENMGDYLVLAEINSRLSIEDQPVENQSELFLGSSAIDYTIGNTEAGDKDFENSLNTAPYSDNSEYSAAVNEISKVINDISDSEEVKNIGSYIESAYNQGVISRNPDNTSEEGGSAVTALQTLTSQGTTYVSKKKAMINIGGINISSFPEVSFTIQTADPLDLKNLALSVTDCGVNIEDFTIEKLNYSSSKIYIVCDKSGSMEGNEEILKEAVRSFVNSLTDKEMAAVVGFSDYVEFASELTNKPSELEESIEKLNASGGTSIASGAFYALEQLEESSQSFNVIVLMTDGQDSTFNTSKLEELAQKCSETNTVLYTIGLGSGVNPEYLEQIADYGNGKFVYCYDVNELEGLYSFLHGQMENSYRITFTAKDTVTNYRTLTVTDADSGASASKSYTLGIDEDIDDEGNFIPCDGEVAINGFSNKKIYKKDTAVTAQITGAGFTSDMSCTVSVMGDAYKGTFNGVFVSEGIFKVEIPEQVPAGTYTATIIIGGRAVSDSIEILLSGELSTVVYGAYTFSAMNITEGDGVITLSGDVSMNDLIHFNGSVTLSGDIDKDTNIRLTEYSGSYISFTKKLPGLLGVMCGSHLALPAFGEITLYNDEAHLNDLDNYLVEKYTVSSLAYGGLVYEGPTVALYPHKLSIVLEKVQFDFPLQEQILKARGMKNPFTASSEAEGLINGSGLYIKGSVKAESLNETLGFSVLSFGLDEFALDFDTYKHDYKLKMIVSTDSLIPSFSEDDSSGYGFSVGFTGGKWDELMLYADFPISVVAVPPVTVSDFFAGISDLASAEQGSGFGRTILQSTLTGGCDIALFKLKDLIPAVGSVFGDLSLVTFDETTLKFSVLNAKLSLSSTVKLLGELECGDVDVKLGKYDYEDYLLGLDEDEVIGFYASVNVGPVLDFPNFKLEVQGNSTVAINNKAVSVKAAGDVDYDINFFRNISDSLNATCEFALVNGNEFVVIIKSSDLKANESSGFKLSLNGWDSYLKLY